MKRRVLLLSIAAVMAVMMAAVVPAMAQDQMGLDTTSYDPGLAGYGAPDEAAAMAENPGYSFADYCVGDTPNANGSITIYPCTVETTTQTVG